MEWYCIHTRPKKEEQVAEYCRRMLGLETYYPRLREQRIIRRVKRAIVGPLFPSYLFCRFDALTSYRSVRYAPEAIDIVRSGSQPAAVSIRLIQELKTWVGDAIDAVALRPQLRAGDMVQVISGPLRGLPAVILRAKDERDRVAILLSILQCGAQMLVAESELRRLA